MGERVGWSPARTGRVALGLALAVAACGSGRSPLTGRVADGGRVTWSGQRPCGISVRVTLTFPAGQAAWAPATEVLEADGLGVEGC